MDQLQALREVLCLEEGLLVRAGSEKVPTHQVAQAVTIPRLRQRRSDVAWHSLVEPRIVLVQRYDPPRECLDLGADAVRGIGLPLREGLDHGREAPGRRDEPNSPCPPDAFEDGTHGTILKGIDLDDPHDRADVVEILRFRVNHPRVTLRQQEQQPARFGLGVGKRCEGARPADQ